MMSDSASDVVTPEYAGFWLRFLAFVIDNIPVLLLLAFILPLFLGSADDIDLTDLSALTSRLLIEALIVAVLFLGFWMIWAATPGKMVFNAHIVDAKTFKRVSNARLVVRYLGYYLSAIPLCLGFLWIAFDPRKQGWHDKLASTVVIRGKPLDDDGS